nr:MAG TPA: hypothetical protein [Microviridae sp.]
MKLFVSLRLLSFQSLRQSVYYHVLYPCQLVKITVIALKKRSKLQLPPLIQLTSVLIH